MALDAIAERGARNVLLSLESGCFGLFRAERQTVRYRAVAPSVEPVSVVGWGDVMLASFLSSRLAGRTYEDALRSAVAAGAAATLELGAGRFDPREAARLAAGVRVDELQALSAP